MRKSLIALDADGVCVDWFGTFRTFANERLGTNLQYGEASAHHLAVCFGVTTTRMQEVTQEFDEEYCNRLFPPINGFVESVAILKGRYNFAVITGRVELYREATMAFFDKYLPRAPVYFSSPTKNPFGGGNGRLSKMESAKQINAAYFIEDNESEFHDWDSRIALPICYAQPWNRSLEKTHPHIPRLVWPEITRLLLG